MRTSFSISIFLIIIVSVTLFSGSLSLETDDAFPAPTEGEGDRSRREKWVEMIHHSAGADWKAIELQNMMANLQRKKAFGSLTGGRMNFANGQVQGYWEEKGSDNVAGNVRAVDYSPSGNTLYVVADEGSLWKKNLGSGEWVLLNQHVPLRNDILQLLTLPGGGERILAGVGTGLWYSDDNGRNFQPSDLAFPLKGLVNRVTSTVVLKDAQQTVYCNVNVEDASGQNRTWIYRSTDKGASFVKIHEFPVAQLSFCNPHNTTDLYVLDVKSNPGSFRLHQIQGSTVTTVSNTAGADIGVNFFMFGSRVNGTTVLYAMTNDDKIFRSPDLGETWTFRGQTPEGPWCMPEVSAQHPDRIFFGGINGHRSFDGGASWKILNVWSHYNGDEENKLHADIMAIKSFKKTDGSPFVIINSHGGTYISVDDMVTVQNLSMKGLRTSQAYDVLTDPSDFGRIFLGTQDQGFQRTASGSDFGVVDFEQSISGDFVNIAMTKSHLWTQYPGTIYYYADPFSASLPNSWWIPGLNASGGAWSAPIEKVADATMNEIFLGGGNLTGGNGAYLIRLAASENEPVVFSARQYDLNFRQASGGSGISAIEAPITDTNRIYVATENGNFFYSNNAGVSWNASASQGPFTNTYGACILASRLTPNTVWFTGAGYASVPVIVSTNGGATFTSMSQGLPSTLVYEIVANESETLLFAATEAGPYVFSMADAQWYPMIGPDNPVQKYTGVEFLSSINTVRFSTYGRGIWDFKIAATPPVTLSASGPVSICQGSRVILTSSSPNGNQWYRDGQVLSGANQQSFEALEAGNYSVTVTGAGGSQASPVVTVRVKPVPEAPVITAEGNTSFCQGKFLTLRSNQSGVMKWFKDGSVNPQFRSDYYVAVESGVYNSKLVKDGCVSALSNTITTVVTNLPVVPIITASSSVSCEGSPVILTSSTTEGLQWFKDGTVISGATQPTYSATQPGSYTVSSSNSCFSYTSPAKLLTLTPAPQKPSITFMGSTSFCQGGSVKLTAPVSASYQWYRDGNPIPAGSGGTSMEYSAVASGSYSLTVGGNGCSSPLSEVVNLTANPVPAKPVITANNNVLTSSSADGNQWYLNGAAITGATGNQYTAQVNGLYAVQVTRNSCSSVLSESFHYVATSVVDLDVWNREIKLYPNPVTEKIFFTNERNRRLEITVMDMLGKRISMHKTSNKNYFIQASGFAKGSYIVIVRDQVSGESRSYHLIKQ